MDNKRRINPIVLGIVVICIVIFGLLIYTLFRVFRTNPLGNEIRIDNFSRYFNNVPQDTLDGIYANLYATVDMNMTEDASIPTSGAVIRDGSTSDEYDRSINVNYGEFIVDIPAIKQSYRGKFNWSNERDNPNLSGYVALFTCLDKSELKYGDFDCSDVDTRAESEIPICNVLPVTVNGFDVASRMAVSYDISCYFESETRAKILINDFSGGNYENALNKIRELGFDPADYTIEYNNQGGNFGN